MSTTTDYSADEWRAISAAPVAAGLFITSRFNAVARAGSPEWQRSLHTQVDPSMGACQHSRRAYVRPAHKGSSLTLQRFASRCVGRRDGTPVADDQRADRRTQWIPGSVSPCRSRRPPHIMVWRKRGTCAHIIPHRIGTRHERAGETRVLERIGSRDGRLARGVLASAIDRPFDAERRAALGLCAPFASHTLHRCAEGFDSIVGLAGGALDRPNASASGPAALVAVGCRRGACPGRLALVARAVRDHRPAVHDDEQRWNGCLLWRGPRRSTRSTIVSALEKAFGKSNISGNLRLDRNVRRAAWLPRLDDVFAAVKTPGVDLSLSGDALNLGAGCLRPTDRRSPTGCAASLGRH